MSVDDVKEVARYISNTKRILSLDCKHRTTTRSGGATTAPDTDFSLEHRRTQSQASSDNNNLYTINQLVHLRYDALRCLKRIK